MTGERFELGLSRPESTPGRYVRRECRDVLEVSSERLQRESLFFNLIQRSHTEPVAARGGDVLDETDACECPELPGDGARADARSTRHLGRTELASVGERVEDLDGANRCFDISGGGLTGTWHRASLFPLIARYPVLRNFWGIQNRVHDRHLSQLRPARSAGASLRR